MERLRTRVLHDPQGEVIERFCAEARRLLGQAHSREEALAIRARVCSKLARETDSPLILDATQTYVDRVIREKWLKAHREEETR